MTNDSPEAKAAAFQAAKELSEAIAYADARGYARGLHVAWKACSGLAADGLEAIDCVVEIERLEALATPPRSPK